MLFNSYPFIFLFLPIVLGSYFMLGRPGHPRLSCLDAAKTWMPGTRPGMTSFIGMPNLMSAF